jgi:hypothetical protein
VKREPAIDFGETQRQIAEWADREDHAKAKATVRGLSTHGSIVYLLFASLALIVLLELSARVK